MDIASEDLAAVRKVLSGRVTLDQVAATYTIRRAALVAVAILQAVGKTTFNRKGEYGDLLYELVIQPGVPADDRDLGLYRERARLINTARCMGLHTSRSGYDARLVPHPQLQELVNEDPAFADRINGLYQQAVQAVEEVRRQKAQREAAQAKEYRQIFQVREAIERHPNLIPYAQKLNDLIIWPQELREFWREIGKILDKYAPEE